MARAKKSSSRAKRKTVDADEMVFEPWKHALVPLHEKLSDKEAKVVLEKYHMTMRELPKVNSNDPALRNLNAKPGDVIRITRKSPTAGTTVFYRGVIDE